MNKRYSKPAIETESALEQTSLACNVLEEWVPNVNFAPGIPGCGTTDERKDPNSFSSNQPGCNPEIDLNNLIPLS